jgi:hypothetical protein
MVVLADSGVTDMMGLGGTGQQRARWGGLQSIIGKPSAESAALRQALQSDTPADQLKTLTAKLKNIRKEELAKLAKAQEELRTLLRIRQEAVVTIAGLLD